MNIRISRWQARCVAAFALLVAAVGFVVAPSAFAATHATYVTVVRPVETNHHLAPGYRVQNQSGPVYCDGHQASTSAVDDNIVYCSPDSAYAVACWRANTAHHVLCEQQPLSHELGRFAVSGAIDSATRPSHPEPLELRLTDGIDCKLRDGGAASPLQGHPDYGATYFCSGDRAVWARDTNRHLGVNETHPVWTVRTAPNSGEGALHTHDVAHVWYVGTRSA